MFVDSIHTDGEPFYEAGFGMLQHISHADFYPNGGVDQPGCPAWNPVCDHGKACEYFLDSIIDGTWFKGVKCGSYEKFEEVGDCGCEGEECTSYMGWLADQNTSDGQYYLKTG